MGQKADYKKQRRNTYGEAPHASRKAIPRAKQRQNQKERRSVRAELCRRDADAAEQSGMRARVRRPFKKVADEPLGFVLMRRVVRQFIRGQITAATFRTKLRRIRAAYPAFVREYRMLIHGYSHVRFDERIVSVLEEFK